MYPMFVKPSLKDRVCKAIAYIIVSVLAFAFVYGSVILLYCIAGY